MSDENDDTGSTHNNDDQSVWDQRSTAPSMADRSTAASAADQVTDFQAKRAAASTRVAGVGAFSMGSFFYTPTPRPGAEAAPTTTTNQEGGEFADDEESIQPGPGPRVNLHRAQAPLTQSGGDEYSVYNNSITFNSSINTSGLPLVDERSHTFLSADILNNAQGSASPGLVGHDPPSQRSNATEDGTDFYEPMRLKSTIKNLAGGFCLLALIITAVVSFAVNVREKKPGLTPPPTVTPVAVKLHHCDVDAGVLAINRDDLTRTERYNELKLVLQAALREQGDSFDDLCSSHDLALTWLADYDGVDVDLRETARIHQRFATAQFYFSTQIPIIDVTPSTKLTPFNWLLDDVSECQWSGVTCNSQSAITAIQVEHTGLRGTIPNELAFLLPSLNTLDLSKNAFTGTIPVSLYSAIQLRYLNLAYNKLRGPIDTIPWTTVDLERMVLSKNAFSGTIPESFVNMSKLMDMDLSSNRFSGPVPDNVFIGLGMKILRIAENDLTGTLPAYISRSLEYLDLKRNDIQGEIPLSLFNLRRLVVLDLSDNNLNGTLSENIANMMDLEDMLLSANKLSGTIPRTLTFLSGLLGIYLSANRFTGTLPTNFGAMVQLVKLSLTENVLTGTLPTELGNMSNLEALELHTNYLSQTIPTEIGKMKSLVFIDFTANDLSGEVPPQVCKLRKGSLEQLDVDCFSKVICAESCCTECTE